MAVRFHMKKKVALKSANRRRNERIVGVFNAEESDGEAFARVEELDRLSNYSVKGKNMGSNLKQGKKRFERGEKSNSEIPRWRMRRADVSRDAMEESKSMDRGQKKWAKGVRAGKSGEANDSRMFPLKPTKAKHKVIDGNASNYDQSTEESRGFYRSKDRRMKAEASSLKIRFKGRKQDMELDSKDEKLDKHSMSKDREIQVSEQNPVRCPTPVFDKTGKKRRFQTKPSENGLTETSDSKKKHRRVIKIDPFDISNKRLEDSVCKTDVAAEKVIPSKNAQFRAIQPNDQILSFVKDNLLGRRRLIELQNAGYNVKLSAPLDNIPFSTSSEKEKIEENVFRNKLEFFAAANVSSSFPPPTIPEIAFAGRSNVGKSSLLNALTRQWGVVRISDKPGLTQTINFFKLASKLCLVDLPGYGFAYAKEEVKEAWEELVKEYVSTRVGLQRVCLLVDTKWGMKARDLELIDLMERSRTPYQIILTKTDIVFPIDVARRAMEVQENLKQNKSIVNPVIMASSKSGAGIRHLRSVLAKIARFVKP